jgi:predicted nucleotide-binding protein (sugar kinase/HSP70/actin superfamily)
MITKFKLYEQLKINEPQIGDYVLCDEVDSEIIRVDFIRNNIGKIVYDNFSKVYKYLVQYENVPELLDSWFSDGNNINLKNCRRMSISEIKNYSKNKEDLEVLIQANKYNL